MNTIESKGFVVVSGLTIFGQGPTIEDARADAREWLDVESHDELAGAELIEYRAGQKEAQMHNRIYIAPASTALVEYVSEHGAPDVWGEVDGTHCTAEEESAAAE